MAYSNSSLFYDKNGVPGATQFLIAADGGVASDITGTKDSDVFIFADGNVGDDTIFGFNRNDSLITHKAIFDGNKDGIITLGNELLDLDRTGGGASKAGDDNITLLRDVPAGEPEQKIEALRYLGTKDKIDYVYADADTRFALDLNNGASKVKEGFVSNDALKGTGGSFDFLYDTALGLNLGGDSITDFGKDDRLVTTVALFDNNKDGFISFGQNNILDLAGELQGAGTYTGVEKYGTGVYAGAGKGPAGQITFDSSVTQLKHLVDQDLVINGVHYYVYGDGTPLTA